MDSKITRSAFPESCTSWCSSLLFTVFFSSSVWKTLSQKWLCQTPCSLRAVGPSLFHYFFSLHVWSGPGLSCCPCCCSWPSSATVFHQNTKPQWSIQAQARSTAAPPSLPPCSDSSFSLPFSLPAYLKAPGRSHSSDLKKNYFYS